jgi:uncharacterized membrane protein (DUF373 family)
MMGFDYREWRKGKSAADLFNLVVDLILKVMAPLVILVLILGVWEVFRDLWSFLREGATEKSFGSLLGSVLSIFVLIELFRSIIDYFEAHRLKITLITETALVFLLREVMIGVYQAKLPPAELMALAVLIFVIGAIRTAAVVFSPEHPPVRRGE